MRELVIVGAGVTGLTLSHLRSDLAPLLLEKSGGPGGRLATRRTETATFDHGAQFYRLTPELSDLHARWTGARAQNLWFRTDEGFHHRGVPGMTALAKTLARGLEASWNTRAVRIARESDRLDVTLEDGSVVAAKSVVVTAPLPQALLLLKESAITAPAELEGIRYAKALVALLEFEHPPAPVSATGYVEYKRNGILSVTDQQRKGVSQVPAWTVVMDPEWSEDHYEHEDSAALSAALDVIAKEFGTRPKAAQLKKWRYSHPIGRAAEPFAAVASAPGLWLAGDGFGGGSIAGAVRSALALAERLRPASR